MKKKILIALCLASQLLIASDSKIINDINVGIGTIEGNSVNGKSKFDFVQEDIIPLSENVNFLIARETGSGEFVNFITINGETFSIIPNKIVPFGDSREWQKKQQLIEEALNNTIRKHVQPTYSKIPQAMKLAFGNKKDAKNGEYNAYILDPKCSACIAEVEKLALETNENSYFEVVIASLFGEDSVDAATNVLINKNYKDFESFKKAFIAAKDEDKSSDKNYKTLRATVLDESQKIFSGKIIKGTPFHFKAKL